MTDIRTKRMELHCNTIDEMKQAMEAGDELSNDFYHAYRYHEEHVPNYPLIWFQLWNFIHIKDHTVIGGACFKGQPNDEGMVEIGYGVEDYYQNQGYATEAIDALIHWAKQQDHVKYVICEIEKGNIPSQKVAEHLGMVKYDEKDGNYYFKK